MASLGLGYLICIVKMVIPALDAGLLEGLEKVKEGKKPAGKGLGSQQQL